MVVDDELGFVLPGFSRHAWTDDAAKDQWEPRMATIRAALQELTLESVRCGISACGLIRARDTDLGSLASQCADRGLAMMRVERKPSPKSTASVTATYSLHTLVCGPLPSGTVTAFVGHSDTLTRLAPAWDRGACAEVAALLEYPVCCGRFLAEIVDERRLDATWSLACNCDETASDPYYITINAEPQTNLLWAPLGITPVPHLTCNFGCAASRHIGQEMTEMAEARGYKNEMGWMRQILSWPVSWSALHGIAETKTPILKMMTRTDSTAGKHTVEWQGAARPDFATPGLSFPHQPPRRLTISESRSFHRGLANNESGSGH